ncbi:MAG: hypothetical protein NT075_05695 [Chloroflexi bacterium]|nr:hypothetical protein [Chloroflexota bacterium]
MIVVSDATPLIALTKIGQLPLLYELLGPVIVPQAVYIEVVEQGAGRSGVTEIASASWIQVQAITDTTKVAYLLADLDIGEAEALVLA